MSSNSGQIPMESRGFSNDSLPDTDAQTGAQLRNYNSVKGGSLEATSGKVFIGENETKYVGATHWAAILEDVRR